MVFAFFSSTIIFAQTDRFISFKKEKNTVEVVGQSQVTPIVMSQQEQEGIQKVVSDLQHDLEKVTGKQSKIINNLPESGSVILVGNEQSNPFIKSLVIQKKVDLSFLKEKWDMPLLVTVDNPFPGIETAVIITGSNKRGIIYAMYEFSEQIGVSPWYFWADVPIEKQERIYIKKGKFTAGEPKVKYRGIFINDEQPALGGWVTENFGGFNHEFYEHVFELILRLKGNYLWPAMWGQSLWDDDLESARIANEWGVVLGNSHHEPMQRAHIEWSRFGKGDWNYESNKNELKKFWHKGIERMQERESILSVGMRGDGDKAMSENANIDLLQAIVHDQRKIIEQVTGKPASETPQLWALYKEVQEYYDNGMRVPEDIILLLCDDNWGNIRKLPKLTEPKRKGGYGIYYHFDYVGGPRNYKWLNTTLVPRTWEQLNLAYQHGVDEIWIVNVGDIKPMELPISFFLEMAWNPDQFTAETIGEYENDWAAKQFPKKYSQQIGDLLKKYTKYNARRKPELLNEPTYSLQNSNEWQQVVDEYNAVAKMAIKLRSEIAKSYLNAYDNLVYYPILLSANLNELYLAAAKNQHYAKQARASTNEWAKKVKELFERDSLLTKQFHTKVNNGKWNHFLSQTHIGYTYWQQPEQNNLPETTIISIPETGTIKANIIDDTLTNHTNEFTVFELYNTGSQDVNYEIQAPDYMNFSTEKGLLDTEETMVGFINWEKAPAGMHDAQIHIKNSAGEQVLPITLINQDFSANADFVESEGVISLEAAHFSAAQSKNGISWKTISNIGKTGDGITPLPVSKKMIDQIPDASVEYIINFQNTGIYHVTTYVSPTIDFYNKNGLHFGLSLNDDEIEPINIHGAENYRWDNSVADNIIRVKSTVLVTKKGLNTLHLSSIDPGVVVQKIVLSKKRSLPKTYLGPSETNILNE